MLGLMLFKISWKNILDKKLNSFLCILLMTLGIAMISLLMLLGKQLQDKFAPSHTLDAAQVAHTPPPQKSNQLALIGVPLGGAGARRP